MNASFKMFWVFLRNNTGKVWTKLPALMLFWGKHRVSVSSEDALVSHTAPKGPQTMSSSPLGHFLKIWPRAGIKKYIHKIRSSTRLRPADGGKERVTWQLKLIQEITSRVRNQDWSDIESRVLLFPPYRLFLCNVDNPSSMGPVGAWHPWVSNHCMDFATTCTHNPVGNCQGWGFMKLSNIQTEITLPPGTVASRHTLHIMDAMW